MTVLTNKTLKDPRIPQIITITKITLSKDLHYCHLYFTIFGNDKEKTRALNGLNSATGFIQKKIGESLDLRYTPKIEFRYDYKDEKAYKVDEILHTLSKERENKVNDKSNQSDA